MGLSITGEPHSCYCPCCGLSIPALISFGHDILNKLGVLILRQLCKILYNNIVILKISRFGISYVLKVNFVILYCLNLTLLCLILKMHPNIYLYLINTGKLFQRTHSSRGRWLQHI